MLRNEGGVAGSARFAAVEVVAESRHDAIHDTENTANHELHHAANADKGQVEG